MRTISLMAVGLSMGVLLSSDAEAKKSDTDSYQGAVSTSTYIKRGKHARVRTRYAYAYAHTHTKARRKWVRVKVRKGKKAKTEWALIRKDRFRFATLIAVEAKRHNIPVRIAIAVGIQESGLNPKAIGDHGRSLGLMQIQCGTAKGIGYSGRCSDLLKPEINVQWGVQYLAMALEGPNGGVWRYNQGIGARRPVQMAARYQHQVQKRALQINLASLGIAVALQ